MKRIMKRVVLPVVMMLSLGYASVASAYQDCNAKQAALEYQLRKAEQYGNYNRVMGLTE